MTGAALLTGAAEPWAEACAEALAEAGYDLARLDATLAPQAAPLEAILPLVEAFAEALPPDRRGVVVHLVEDPAFDALRHAALAAAIGAAARAVAPRLRVNAAVLRPELGLTADDVAAAVRQLATNEALTAQTLVVDAPPRWSS